MRVIPLCRFARAALATPLGRSSNFSVLEATDLDQESPGDPIARLVWRIHRDESGSGWHHSPAFDACYRVEFNEYGVVTDPSRIDCPENATAYTPPPVPKRNIPREFRPALLARTGASASSSGCGDGEGSSGLVSWNSAISRPTSSCSAMTVAAAWRRRG
ncbi:hypothetical protein [Haloechinothrix salitolerans]|uniref:Uncharacterized protein n=1 Tax=Haloechinothrix salitolerans TaxID=926830 RepID=A0ABW2BTN8_9PSEU